MPRIRTYATAADRQRAYRARLAAQQPPVAPAPARPRRSPSRPKRLAALETAVRDLLAEYESWLESLPESLADSRQAERVRETIEQLETAAEALAEAEPPRGFGRD